MRTKSKSATTGFKDATSFHSIYFTPKSILHISHIITKDKTVLLSIFSDHHDITIDICTKAQAIELHKVTGEMVDFFTHEKKGTAK